MMRKPEDSACEGRVFRFYFMSWGLSGYRHQMTPWPIIALATFMKPAMLAPFM